MVELILVGLILTMLVFSIRIAKATSKSRKQAIIKGMERVGVNTKNNFFTSIEHISGLNVPEGIECSIGIGIENIIILCADNEYIISLNKIKSVDSKNDVNVTLYNKSSVAKGVAGAAVFGAAGAVIGSAPQNKEKREIKGCAIIGYENTEGEDRYIILKDQFANTFHCDKFSSKLRSLINKSSGKRVEL